MADTSDKAFRDKVEVLRGEKERSDKEAVDRQRRFTEYHTSVFCAISAELRHLQEITSGNLELSSEFIEVPGGENCKSPIKSKSITVRLLNTDRTPLTIKGVSRNKISLGSYGDIILATTEHVISIVDPHGKRATSVVSSESIRELLMRWIDAS